MIISNSFSSSQIFYRLAVLGAAGKMGKGISLLLLQEMSLCGLQQLTKETLHEPFRLVLIDTSWQGLDGLRKYLLGQLERYAEKNIIALRKAVDEIPNLVSNKEIIDCFLDRALEIVQFATSAEEAKEAQLIFEAIVEDMDSKVALLSTLYRLSIDNPYFFSNTSSIPLSVLDSEAGLDGRIIGFHFYNPPAVQKLIEVIPLEEGDPKLTKLAESIAQKLNKQVIFSKDIAGFIGNGYLLREATYACGMVQELSVQKDLVASIYIINKVTQEFLLRPMGIFQLIDYVGLDVVEKIGEIMNKFLPHPFYHNELIELTMKAGKMGGQFSDGSQKEGFFQYAHHKIVGIYDLATSKYCPLENAEWRGACDRWLGTPPEGFTWKSLSVSSEANEQIQHYFATLKKENSIGAQLALDFLKNFQDIVQGLVKDGVAASSNDVATVLKKGFFHLYDPTKIY